jgi:hypothetical protein
MISIFCVALVDLFLQLTMRDTNKRFWFDLVNYEGMYVCYRLLARLLLAEYCGQRETELLPRGFE